VQPQFQAKNQIKVLFDNKSVIIKTRKTLEIHVYLLFLRVLRVLRGENAIVFQEETVPKFKAHPNLTTYIPAASGSN